MARPTKKEQTAKKISEAMSKMDDARINKLKEVFALDGTIEEACFFAEISVQTYYNWIEKNPELLEEFDRIRQTPILAARREVVNGITKNPEFSMRFLERKLPKEFGLRTKIEHSGVVSTLSGEIPKEIEDVKDKYEEALRKALIKSHDKDKKQKEPSKI